MGCDTITKSNYITVSGECPTIMSASSYKWIYACSGILYDDGGPANNYFYFGRGAVHIYPHDADTVWIQFLEFDFFDNDDFLHIYCSGDTTQAPDYSFTGSLLPNNGQPIACPTGQMLVKTILVNNNQCPDGCTGAGFKAKWWSDAKTIADFDLGFFATDLKTCEDEYLFINSSYCADRAKWFFEDFAYDTSYHTYHNFYGESRAPIIVDVDFPSALFTGHNPYRDGYYEVILIAENDYGFKDTIKKRVIINKPRGDFGVDPMPATILDNPITFYDMTQPAFIESWTWRFDDGFLSGRPFFKRTLDTPGTYKIELVVCGAMCCDTVVKHITVYEQDPFTMAQTSQSNNTHIFPNPVVSGHYVFIQANVPTQQLIAIAIRDLTGKLVDYKQTIPQANKFAIPINLPQGTYVLELLDSNQQLLATVKLQVIK
ncbi:MAG: T9SS type A sorting domain-containing protein [Chlorobi bacterium]|nr:T9SS type A sorting domain-containing protein [Chlorobiota bacterium]